MMIAIISSIFSPSCLFNKHFYPCRVRKKFWPTGWHGESLHFQRRSVHRVRITINKSHSSEVHPNQPQGSFFCWAPVSVSCKVISKVPLKKRPLPVNFDHQKKQQSTFPKESQSWGDCFRMASQNVPNRKNFFKSSLFQPEGVIIHTLDGSEIWLV